MLLDPDPHSKYGSGSKSARSMLTHVDPDPQQHWSGQMLTKGMYCTISGTVYEKFTWVLDEN
jgi:hypothetical protein